MQEKAWASHKTSALLSPSKAGNLTEWRMITNCVYQHKIIKITKLTFLQPFSFPNFLSFLSKQQAPMLLCVKCRVEWGCRPLKCLSLSLTTAWVKGPSLCSLTLGNATALVTHSGLRGLIRLYLTPCVCGAMTVLDLCYIHTPSWGSPASSLFPPLLLLLAAQRSCSWQSHLRSFAVTVKSTRVTGSLKSPLHVLVSIRFLHGFIIHSKMQ